MAYGQWWYQRKNSVYFEEDGKEQDYYGVTQWAPLIEGKDCDKQQDGMCWAEDFSASQFYRSTIGDREFPISCEFGFQNSKYVTDKMDQAAGPNCQSDTCHADVTELYDRECWNQEYTGKYSPELSYQSGSKYGTSVFYNKEKDDKAFTHLVQSMGDSGMSQANIDDIGCRHLTLSELPVQINSMCNFRKNITSGAVYIQTALENTGDAFLSQKTQGVGVTIRDANPAIILEAVNSEYLAVIHTNPGLTSGRDFRFDTSGLSTKMGHALGLTPSIGSIYSYKLGSDGYDPLFSLSLATLGMNLVQLGDDLEKTNWILLNKCCSLNGEIIRPDVPIVLPDSLFHSTGSQTGSDGILWNTYSSVDVINNGEPEVMYSDIILSYKLTESRELFTSDLTSGRKLLYDPRQANCLEITTDKIEMSPTTETALVYATDGVMFQNKLIGVIGDITKFVPLSKQRINKVKIDTSGFRIEIINPINSGNGKFEKTDLVTLAFCSDSKLIQKSFKLEPTGSQPETEDEKVTKFLFDPITESITCENCETSCIPCQSECPAECPAECGFGDNDQCSNIYSKCEFDSAEDAYCLSFASCPAGQLFNQEINPCQCISDIDCQGCSIQE